MYKLTLTDWEQVQLEACLPPNAPLADLEQLLRIKDAIGLQGDKREAVDLRIVQVPTQTGTGSVPFWNGEKLDALAGEVSLEIESEDFKKLKSLVTGRSTWPMDKRSVGLKNKIDNAEEVKQQKDP